VPAPSSAASKAHSNDRPAPAGDPVARDLHAIAGGAGLSLFGRIATGGLVFVYGVVVARLLDVRSVGILMLGLAIVRIAELLARMGLEIGTMHYVSILAGSGRASGIRPTIRNAVGLVLACSIAVAAVLMLTAPLASRIFGMPELSAVLRILAAAVPPMSVAMILLAALLGLKQIAYNTIGERIALPASNLVICAALLTAGLGAQGASAAYVVSATLTVPLALWYLTRCTEPARSRPAPVPVRDLLRFSAPIVLAVILTQVLLWTDTLMLGLLGTASEVGIYSAAARTALVLSMVVASFNGIFAPTISDLYHRGELAHLKLLFKTVSKWMFLVTCPLALVLVLLSGELMLLFGPAFAGGAGALQILLVAQLVASGTGAVGFMLMMSGRQKAMLINTVVACVVNVGLNAAFIPGYGIEGAAIATCISIAVYSLLALVEVQWTLKMHPYANGHWRVAAAGVAAFVVLALAKPHIAGLTYLETLAVYSAAYAALYLAGLFVLGMAKDEKLLFSTLKGRLLGRS
jgi:O-antigen/teichoic acid export membrane protein